MPLHDLSFFIERCTIINDTLAWDVVGDRDPYKCLDIDPETLYEVNNVVAEQIA